MQEDHPPELDDRLAPPQPGANRSAGCERIGVLQVALRVFRVEALARPDRGRLALPAKLRLFGIGRIHASLPVVVREARERLARYVAKISVQVHHLVIPQKGDHTTPAAISLLFESHDQLEHPAIVGAAIDQITHLYQGGRTSNPSARRRLKCPLPRGP